MYKGDRIIIVAGQELEKRRNTLLFEYRWRNIRTRMEKTLTTVMGTAMRPILFRVAHVTIISTMMARKWMGVVVTRHRRWRQ